MKILAQSESIVASPRSSLKRGPRRAFTLLELLVVMTIVAILSVILLPVFVQAQESAKKANCVSNLKQIGLAFLLYAGDYDDVMEKTHDPMTTGSTVLTWWASYKETPPKRSEYNPRAGNIQPYIKSVDVIDCPSALEVGNHLFWADGTFVRLAYARTSASLGLNLSELEIPSETILLGDAAAMMTRTFTSEFELVRRDFLQTSYTALNQGALHGRHGGGSAAVLWLDGHVKAQSLAYKTYGAGDPYNSPSFEVLRERRLGLLLKYPQQVFAPGENFQRGANGRYKIDTDFYYYVARQKPGSP